MNSSRKKFHTYKNLSMAFYSLSENAFQWSIGRGWFLFTSTVALMKTLTMGVAVNNVDSMRTWNTVEISVPQENRPINSGREIKIILSVRMNRSTVHDAAFYSVLHEGLLLNKPGKFLTSSIHKKLYTLTAILIFITSFNSKPYY